MGEVLISGQVGECMKVIEVRQETWKWYFTQPSGDTYKGDWDDDKFHRKGAMTWPSGNMYEGNWNYSKKHGKGIYRYADGPIMQATIVKVSEMVQEGSHGRMGATLK